jgi:hypothetical protein
MSEHEPGPSREFYLRHAGRIIWPRNVQDLTDTALCPACHTPLTSPICSACRLDLRNGAAAELLACSADAAAALERRAEVIGRIRYETESGRSASPARPGASASASASASVAVRPIQSAPSAPTASLIPEPAREAAAGARVASVAPPPEPPEPPEPHGGPDAAPPARARSQRSSVQVVLLTVGVLLVSVAAIFFLTVAWIVAGLGFRSVVVALLTVAALAVAARMRRSRLTATAEGIGSFAVVLVLLDVWGLRQNNLFGLAAGDGALYWGLALVMCAVLFLSWHAWSNLRVGSVAGFVAVVPGLGLLAAGLVQGQDTLTRVFIGFLGAAVAALVHRATLPRSDTIARRWPAIDRFPERMLLLAMGALALMAAAVVAVFVQSDSLVAPIWCLGAVALIATAHTVLTLQAPHSAIAPAPPLAGPGLASPVPAGPATPARSMPARSMAEYRSFAYVSASLAALAVAGIAPVMADRYGSTPFTLTVPLLIAVALAAALESFGRHFGAPSAVRTAGLIAAGSAATVAVLPLLVAAGYAAWPLARATANGLRGREAVSHLANADNGWALLALIGVGAILFIGWGLGGLLHARRQIVTALAVAVIVLAVPFVESIGLIVALYVLLGAGALLTLSLSRLSLGFLAPAGVAILIAGETFGYLTSWAHPATWWYGTASLALALWFSRRLVARAGFSRTMRAHARGALLSAAIVITLIGLAHVPLALAPELSWSDSVIVANVTAALALGTALLLLAVAALRPPVLTLLERRWAFFTLLVPTLVVFAVPLRSPALAGGESLLQPEPIGGILRAALLVTAVALWVFLPRNRGALHWERMIAALALAPALLLLVREVLLAANAVTTVFSIAPMGVALVVCALALLRGTVGSTPAGIDTGIDTDTGADTGAAAGAGVQARRDRIALELGATMVLFPTVITALVTFRSLGWLVIVLAGIVALIMATAPDGLFGSSSIRRHFGWLALLLGTVGLWLGLAWNGIVALEPYVLPVAGVVLLTAALVRRYGRIDQNTAASPVAAMLTLAGLLIALAPLAVASQSGSLVRPIIVALVSAALVLGVGVLRWSPPHSNYLAAAGLAGSIALAITAVMQTQRLLGTPGAPDGRLELWLLSGAAVTVTTAFLLAHQTDPASAQLRRGAGIALVLAWACVLAWIELGVVTSPADAGLSAPRAVLLVLTLSAVHVVALWRPRAPLGVLTGWSVLALAGLAAVTAATFGVVDPFELVTVPVALALIGSGWLRLHGDPRARSWPFLGPGVALLLVPSLLLDLTYSDLWRIVGLGIAAIAVLVIGSTRRLQAPFVIGAVVLIVHGVAQLWPWIALAYSAIPWFLWLGAGGIVLIVLAARYERRIANLKSVALRITALR